MFYFIKNKISTFFRMNFLESLDFLFNYEVIF